MEKDDKLNDALATIGDAANLVSALQILLRDVCGMTAEEPLGNDMRDALVGIGDALQRVLHTPPK